MYGLGMAKGLLVTLKNLTKRPFTVQYPEERLKQHPRFRGEEFVWYEERCTGCASCAKYCPLGIIKIVTSPSETAEIQRYVDLAAADIEALTDHVTEFSLAGLAAIRARAENEQERSAG